MYRSSKFKCFVNVQMTRESKWKFWKTEIQESFLLKGMLSFSLKSYIVFKNAFYKNGRLI